MSSLRSFLLGHRSLTALLLAATLCLKAVVPTGYMMASQDMALKVTLCTGSLATQVAPQATLPGGHEQGQPDHHGKGLCPFSALNLDIVGGANPALLALAILFIMLAALAPRRIALPDSGRHLRPPLRGPPLAA